MPTKLFISYAHEDEKYKEALTSHLSGLERSGKIDPWNDREIQPGQEWDDSIKRELEAADIILFLISSDFIASNYIHDVEIEKAMHRFERGQVQVVPIILRPCHWTSLPIAKLQALPKNAKPISSWEDQDEAWLSTVKGISSIIDRGLGKGDTKSEPEKDNNIPKESPVDTDYSFGMSQVDIAKQLVMNGKLDKALKNLLEITANGDQDAHNSLIMLSGRLSNLKKDANLGVITNEQSNLNRNRITHALLSILDEMDTL